MNLNNDSIFSLLSMCGLVKSLDLQILHVSTFAIMIRFSFLSSIWSSFAGERRQFANRIKALNRLKAMLLVIAQNQGVSSVCDIDRNTIVDAWQKEARKYTSLRQKLVHDVKTGIQIPGLNSVLDGNLEPLIAAHVNSRQSDKI